MAARLGNVIYWFCVFPAIFFLLLALGNGVVLIFGSPEHPGDDWFGFFIALLAALGFYGFGRVARYILRGPRNERSQG